MWRCSLLFVIFAVSAAAKADGSERERLARGETIVQIDETKEGGPALARVTGIINAPPEKVWTLIDRCSEYRRFLPRVSGSEELSRAGDQVRCRVVIDTPWPLSDLTSVTRATHVVSPTLYKRSWTLESGDYLVNEGSWTLTPYEGGRTLAVYEIRSQLRQDIPAFVRDLVQRRAMPEMMEALRRQSAKP